MGAALLDGQVHEATAQTATVQALTGQSCAGTRFGAKLGCTANDFSSSLTFDQPSASALASCVAGQTVSIDVIAQISSNSPTRYDGAYFIGEMGTSPELNDATKTCSLAVFPLTPAPFVNVDGNACGDYQASASSTLLIEDVAIKCTPVAGTNQLAIPYVLVFNNQSGPANCSSANITANTKSKCVSSTTATVTGVTVNGYIQITKQTLPDGHSQSFGFTGVESGGATVTPSSFNLTDGQTRIVEVPFTSAGGARTLTVTESAVSGWDPTASITCTTPTGASASSYVTVNNTNRTITATLSPTNFGAVCTITNTKIPTVKVQKQTAGGTGGPFGFTTVNLASAPAGITTSSIGVAAPVSPTAINATTLGSQVQLTEGSVTNYRITGASCTDSESALTFNTGSIGSLSGSTLTIPGANVKPGAEFTCLFNNAKIPTLKLRKITTGGTAGPFVFSAGNLASTPSDITTSTVGTAAPASPAAIDINTIGADVTVTESAFAGYELLSASCTDANSAVTGNSGTFGTLSGSTLTIPAARVVPGADFICTFTNRKTPLVKVQKVTDGNFGGPFTFGQTNLASTPAAITTTAVNTAAPASPTAIAVTTVGADVSLTETVATGYVLTGASCVDANSAITGNTGLIGTLSGSTLTIPASAVVAGADFTCTFSNRKVPTVKLQKQTLGGFGGSFSFSQTNLAATPSAIATTAAAVSAPASPTAVAVTALGTDITLTEAVAAGYFFSSASCTDANSAITGNTGSFGTVTGTTLTIPAAQVVAGADFTCVFTNTLAVPQLSVTKTPSVPSVDAAGDAISYTILVSNTGNVDITSITVSDPLGTVTCTTSGNATIATLAPAADETCTMSYAATQVDFDTRGGGDNDIDNTVTASGSYGATPVQGIGNATVALVLTPGLSVTKLANDTTDVVAGQTITYTYVVSNTGNQTIANIALGDSHNAAGPAPLPRLETLTTNVSGASTDATADNGVWSSLAPGDAVTFTGTYVVQQSDVETLQ